MRYSIRVNRSYVKRGMCICRFNSPLTAQKIIDRYKIADAQIVPEPTFDEFIHSL